MKNIEKTLFISDIHLDSEHAAITSKFLHLMNEIDPSVTTIYILGDLFEVWIGETTSDLYVEVISVLRRLTRQGKAIFFLPGNRDFLLGKQFSEDTGCVLLPDEAMVDLYGTKVLLMHGDSLCIDDHAYMKLRKLTKNKFLQKILTILPLFILKKLAKYLRRQSKLHTQTVSLKIQDVNLAEVNNRMSAHGVKFLIHGHTHKPCIHSVDNGLRFVLGAWHKKASVLSWDATGRRDLLEF